ncbi:MAG: hypothetical protein JAY63_03180 [Candidatus Thiodiazotropha taylori]|nr:hypothetical protein [Candidatus Thiodiazotropha taylori]
MPSGLNPTNTFFSSSYTNTNQDNPIVGQADNSSKTKLDSMLESPTTEEQLSSQSTPLSQKMNQPSLSEQSTYESKNILNENLCIAKGDTGDKKSEITTQFWGIKREIKCTYICSNSNSLPTEIRGTHVEKNYLQYYRESDDGREGQCLGAVYGEPVFNPTTLRESYSRTHFEHFSPESSGSKELEDWAKNN